MSNQGSPLDWFYTLGFWKWNSILKSYKPTVLQSQPQHYLEGHDLLKEALFRTRFYDFRPIASPRLSTTAKPRDVVLPQESPVPGGVQKREHLASMQGEFGKEMGDRQQQAWGRQRLPWIRVEAGVQPLGMRGGGQRK